MSIKDNYNEILKRKDAAAVRSGRNPEDVLLLPVTKLHPASELNEVIDAGATDIGENKVQEILEKIEDVKPVRWHLIGHLQTNKVKNIIDKVVMIHSVDSFHLAQEINKRATAEGLTMDILIQINSAMEETKSGIPAGEVRGLCEQIVFNLENVRIRGLMCIPPMANTPEDNRPYFAQARGIFEDMKTWDLEEDRFQPDTLSMGMSGDFEVAIEEGSTIVRVGTSIMGKRDYR